MKFGLIYSFQVPKESDATHAQLYQEGLKQAEIAEGLGYDSVFLVEHHFLEDGMNPSLLPTAAAIAARTERVTVGTSCYLLPLHHPIETAENAAVVDNISDGRLTMAVAAAYREEEFAGFALKRQERGQRMDEYLDILQSAWTKDAFSFRGRFYSCENLSVTPKPIQRPIPMWFGASGVAGLRRAASRGMPLVGSNRHNLSELEQQFSTYRDFLGKFGKTVSEVPLLRQVYLADSTERAIEDSADSHMAILGGMYGKWAKWRKMVDDTGRTPDTPGFYDFESHRAKVVVGTAEDAVKQVEVYRKKLGVNHLLCWMAMPGMPDDNVTNSMKLFAKDVIPSFR